MGIREKLNKSSKLTVGVIVVATAAIYGFVVWEMHSSASGSRPAMSYFSIDDGQSYFADSLDLNPPFDHNGSEAVRCYVYKTSKGTKFVAYLEKDPKALLDALNAPVDPNQPNYAEFKVLQTGLLVKKPGDKDWVNSKTAKGQEITHPKSPDGSSEDPTIVVP